MDVPDAVCWSEYEEWPRGRIVFDRSIGRFVLCADRKLQTPAILASIRERFALMESEAEIRSDPHYVSVR